MIGFDTDKYLEAQEKAIRERISKFKGKVYLEFGGKIVDDGHAERVLKGYRPNAKVELLKRLEADADFIFCVSAKDIINNRQRGDFKINYAQETIRVINRCKELGLDISKIVITLNKQGKLHKKIDEFCKMLYPLGKELYFHRLIDNYLNCGIEDLITNVYIKTDKKIVVITGAGGGSGKFGVCITQLAHDFEKGLNSGYAKFETFPIWNLPLNHPINKAYESATADLGDINLLDNHHLEAYGVEAVNYNRDIENFGLMKKMLFKVTKKDNFIRTYKSPTDMGFNMAKVGIFDFDVVTRSAIEECKRRVGRYAEEVDKGLTSKKTLLRAVKVYNDVKSYERKG